MRIIDHIWISGEPVTIIGRHRTIKQEITHQGIGGKDFVVEGEVPFDSIVESAVFRGNWACKNYLDRRENAVRVKRHYYGKVGGLGYIVGCDEFEEGDFDD